ncbi:MAG: hypothetical protein RIQ46_1135 [Pseudomonadota bacterium]
MKSQSRRSALDQVVANLREWALSVPEDTLLGNEESLVDKLAAGRNTVRQAARLLEREGFVRVRCGISGGYFAARPDLGTIEQAASAYLTSIAVTVKDVTYVASLLWEEVVRRAARLPSAEGRDAMEALIAKVAALPDDADFPTVMELEQAIRNAIFEMTDSAYIEMIFQINYAFAERVSPSEEIDASQCAPGFPEIWRQGKLMELGAIRDRDEKLAVMAAHHSRNRWHEHFWGRSPL